MKKALAEKKYNAIYRYPKASNKYVKDFYKNKESSYLKYFGINNLYICIIGQCYKKFQVNKFE